LQIEQIKTFCCSEDKMNKYNINVEKCAKEKYSWSHLIYVIQNQLFPLSRSFSQEYEYQRRREQIQEQWISVHDFVLCTKFDYEKVLVSTEYFNSEVQTENQTDSPYHASSIRRPPSGAKYKAVHPVKPVKPIRVLSQNDFPYYLEDQIYHLILWKLHSSITTDDIIWAKEEVANFMKEIAPNKKVINILHWTNPPQLKSLPDIDHVHIVCRVSDSNHDCEIFQLINERIHLRKQKKWNEADQIKLKLRKDPFSVNLIDWSDGTTAWEKIIDKYQPTEKHISWSKLEILELTNDHPYSIPLVVATVNTPNYRKRLEDTKNHIGEMSLMNCVSFGPILPIDLLNNDEFPSIGPRRILYEGWRQILLPRLEQLSKDIIFKSHDFILVAEDDIRFPSEISPCLVRKVCKDAFRANSSLHVLSLGHSSAAFREKEGQTLEYNDNLLEHLQDGGKIHGTTLLAVRAPGGIHHLMNVMNDVQMGKRTHFDQFLFHSPHHNTNVAISNPPLAGWCESEKTLTSVGPGCRRNGGGRLGHLPSVKMKIGVKINWVYRQLQ
jgi:hypothetical protein